MMRPQSTLPRLLRCYGKCSEAIEVISFFLCLRFSHRKDADVGKEDQKRKESVYAKLSELLKYFAHLDRIVHHFHYASERDTSC